MVAIEEIFVDLNFVALHQLISFLLSLLYSVKVSGSELAHLVLFSATGVHELYSQNSIHLDRCLVSFNPIVHAVIKQWDAFVHSLSGILIDLIYEVKGFMLILVVYYVRCVNDFCRIVNRRVP